MMQYSFSEHLKQNLYKNPSPVIKVRLDGTIDFFNRAFIRAAGLTADQVKQLPGTSAVPILGKLIWRCLEFVEKPEQPDGTLSKFVFPSDMARAEKRLWSLAVAQSTEDNLLDGMICTLVAPEAEKQDGFKMLENILFGSPGAVVACTPELELRGVNQKFADLLGGKMDDYKGKSLAALVFDFEDFKRTFQQNEGKFAFSCVLQNVRKDAIYCVVSSNSLAPNMLSNSEHSGISKLYYIIQFLPLDEQQSQIVEVLNGKNLALANRVSELQAENKHLLATSAPGATELLAQITVLQADMEKLRKEKEELELQLSLLRNSYNVEKQACQNEKAGIIADHQVILQEKQAVLGNLSELQLKMEKLKRQHEDAKILLQDEILALKAVNNRLELANGDLQAELNVAQQSYQEANASVEANQHLQSFTSGSNNELDEKTRECENLSRIVLDLEASVAESDAELGTARDLAARQVEVSQRVLEAREAALADLQEKIEELHVEHRRDLDKVALAQKMTLDDLKQKHADELRGLREECSEKFMDNENSHQDVCAEYEKAQRTLVDLRRQLAEWVDVPVAMSGRLLVGAVKILENVSDIFAESLSDLPADLKDSPAVKNMLAAKKDLEKLVGCLNSFDDAFLKTSPSRYSLLETCQSWQEEFTRQYPDRDLYFKYPVDGEFSCYELPLRAIVRELLNNAVEATLNQPNGEVKVKIQIKSPEEMVKCHFKKEINNLCLLVQVLDSGENWFDPEQAVKHYYSNKDGHLGLGLSTCRFLVEKMGGELELRSTTNGGVAMFYIPV